MGQGNEITAMIQALGQAGGGRVDQRGVGSSGAGLAEILKGADIGNTLTGAGYPTANASSLAYGFGKLGTGTTQGNRLAMRDSALGTLSRASMQEALQVALLREQLNAAKAQAKKRTVRTGGGRVSGFRDPYDVQKREGELQNKLKLDLIREALGLAGGGRGITDTSTSQQIVNNAGSYEPRTVTSSSTRSILPDLLALLR